jgi:hypothetical protein
VLASFKQVLKLAEKIPLNFWSPDSCEIACNAPQTQSIITAAVTFDDAQDNTVQVECT